MRDTYPAKEKQFKKYQSGGNGVALFDLLEEERQPLFDYLLRMTGQVSRSAESIDEVFSSLTKETLSPMDHYAELKVCVYSTARRFNADIWNADTAKLSNAALPSFVPGGIQEVKGGAKFYPLLDRALRFLPGPERDAVLLYVLGDFEPDETGLILGNLSASEAAVLIQGGLTRLNAEVEVYCGPAEKALRQLPLHPLPPRSSTATVNLSMVMRGLKTKPVGIWSPVRIGLLGVLLGLAVTAWLHPELVQKLVDTAKGKVSDHPVDKPDGPSVPPPIGK